MSLQSVVGDQPVFLLQAGVHAGPRGLIAVNWASSCLMTLHVGFSVTACPQGLDFCQDKASTSKGCMTRYSCRAVNVSISQMQFGRFTCRVCQPPTSRPPQDPLERRSRTNECVSQELHNKLNLRLVTLPNQALRYEKSGAQVRNTGSQKSNHVFIWSPERTSRESIQSSSITVQTSPQA